MSLAFGGIPCNSTATLFGRSLIHSLSVDCSSLHVIRFWWRVFSGKFTFSACSPQAFVCHVFEFPGKGILQGMEVGPDFLLQLIHHFYCALLKSVRKMLFCYLVHHRPFLSHLPRRSLQC